jgi:hypothetical protein
MVQKKKSDDVNSDWKSVMLSWNGKKLVNKINDEWKGKQTNIMGIIKWSQGSKWMIDIRMK